MDTDDASAERWAWVALALVPEVGWNARRYHELLAVGPPVELFRASRRALASKVGDELARAVIGFDARAASARQRAAAETSRARLITLDDADYPAALKQAPLPPPFLFVRGTPVREDGLAVAIVGSRRPTPYGVKVAERLAGDLAARGVTVVSGFARGVDTAAHRGALAAGGRTLAVLGSGVDVVYPPENRPLVTNVAGAGAVVSQFPMETPPLAAHFPIRNRVIAGLTLGTVVVEAAEKSGALITARFAGELGREVYAVPGNVSSLVSEGTNRLIQDGAKLVRAWEDVVAEWPAIWRQALRPVPPVGGDPCGAAAGLRSATESRLLPLLGDEPVAIDHVIAKTGLPAGEVAASLMAMELRGLVRQLPGQRYVKA
ncbi:MAG TPA: DNA-processing protein DprA [Methylomirabilota bacterium]|jgi:DNA processing protein|nr:DNA-processing protein DprA [Methylomirabilota bacterium]